MQKPDPSPIERQLEAHGQRRRQAMGEPFTLPPATQEMLRAEVKRQYPPETTPSARFSWLAWWPKLAWTGAIAGALLLVLAPLVQRTASVAHVAGGRSGEMELAQAPALRTVVAPAAEFEESAKKAKVARAVRDKAPLENKLRLEEERIQAGTELKLARSAAKANSLADQPVAATVPMPAKAPATAPVSEAMKRRFGLQPALGSMATNTSLGVETFSAGKSLAAPPAAASADAQFGSMAMGTNHLVAAPANGAILNNFQFTQSGQEIQIQDEDGSIYSGKIVPRLEAGEADLALAKKANAPAVAVAGATSAFQNSAGGRAVDTNANVAFYFRLAGTNLSSRQKVEIEGALANTEPLVPASGGQGGAAPIWNFSPTNPNSLAAGNKTDLSFSGQVRFDNSLAPNRFLFQNALSPLNYRVPQNANYLNNHQAKDQRPSIRLQGQAIVGGTSQVPIDAYPHSP